MRFLIIIVITFFTNFSLGQISEPFDKYYILINAGNDFYDSARYQDAFGSFSKAFRLVKNPFAKDLNRGVNICIQLEKFDVAKSYLRKAATYGFIPNDSVIMKIQKTDTSILTSLNIITEDYFKKRNTLYLQLVDSLYLIDQKTRNNLSPSLNQINTDSTNTLSLINASMRYGFPSEYTVGIDGAWKAFVIFLHADFDFKNALLGQILLNAVKSGQFKPIDYAQVIDRRCNFSGRPFIYYQIPFGYDELTAQQKDTVNRNRALIGLRIVEKVIEYKFSTNGILTTRQKE